jgi:hypothetical protein
VLFWEPDGLFELLGVLEFGEPGVVGDVLDCDPGVVGGVWGVDGLVEVEGDEADGLVEVGASLTPGDLPVAGTPPCRESSSHDGPR